MFLAGAFIQASRHAMAALQVKMAKLRYFNVQSNSYFYRAYFDMISNVLRRVDYLFYDGAWIPV
jgi:hypothetical protein